MLLQSKPNVSPERRNRYLAVKIKDTGSPTAMRGLGIGAGVGLGAGLLASQVGDWGVHPGYAAAGGALLGVAGGYALQRMKRQREMDKVSSYEALHLAGLLVQQHLKGVK